MFRFLTVIFSVLSVSLFGQSVAPIVSARFVPDSIAIGDQFKLRVEVSKDMIQQISFPEFNDNKLGDKIEILSESAIDTVSIEGRAVTLAKEYLLTIFEDGRFSAGRFPLLYSDKNIIDTLWSKDSLLLEVGTFDIDTTKQTIFDIKEPLNTPLKFGEFSGYLLWGLLIAAIIAALVYYFIKRKKSMPLFGKPKPIDPPHVVAIKELEAVHNQKLWQNSKHKLYYTRLTDIIRAYIESRYGIAAMEMTTEEIMQAIKPLGIAAQSIDNLRSLLIMADFVKFAKHIPEAIENESSYTSAYYFVEETKPQEINNETEEK